MTFTTKKLPDSIVELTVNLERRDLIPYVAQVKDYLTKKARIDGFRPGRAPQEKALSRMDEDKIREESLRVAVESSLSDVLAREDFDVIRQLDFKIKENSSERLIYQTRLLIFPKFILGNYKGLGIKRRKITVTESEVKSAIDELVDLRTVFNEVERPAQKGDRVEVDFTVRYKGEVIEGGRSENHPIILGKGKFVPGFEENLFGMSKGETRHFTLKIPADFYQKSIADKVLDFEVVMKKVEDRVVPKLDDDFAKSLGNFGSLRELMASVKEGLTMEKEIRERDRVRLAILTKIASMTDVEVPRLLVEERLDKMIQDLDSELHQRGLELGLYLAQINKTQDELRRDWRSQAESQVKMDLITKAVAKEEKLRVDEGEVEEELEIILQRYLLSEGKDGAELLREIDTSELKNKIRDTLLNEKVLEFLEKQNVVV